MNVTKIVMNTCDVVSGWQVFFQHVQHFFHLPILIIFVSDTDFVCVHLKFKFKVHVEFYTP